MIPAQCSQDDNKLVFTIANAQLKTGEEWKQEIPDIKSLVIKNNNNTLQGEVIPLFGKLTCTPSTDRKSGILSFNINVKTTDVPNSNSKDPLFGRWISRDENAQPYAFTFQKSGNLVIAYRSSSGRFESDAKYQISNLNENYGNYRALDLILGENQIVKTIFKIEEKDGNLLLRIARQEVGQPRPKEIAQNKQSEFTLDFAY